MQCFVYQPRRYRNICHVEGLEQYRVCEKESDLLVLADHDIRDQAQKLLHTIRQELTDYISVHPEYGASLNPVQVPAYAPWIVQCMAEASARLGVGPMAAVAGAISESIAQNLNASGCDIIIENGGDIFAFFKKPLKVALYAGSSPLSMKIGLSVSGCATGMSICTSSGSVGHSLSYGNADAVSVVARDGALADATATALGNRVQNAADIDGVLDYGIGIEGILGIVIVVGQHIGIKGDLVELCCM